MVSIVVLTYNEEANIVKCLESIREFESIFVVDSGSTDRTVEICRRYTDRIYIHPYTNHASQWQWAFENLVIQSDWVLALDADFVVTNELKNEMAEKLPKLAPDVSGVYVLHRYVFGGTKIRFGGTKKFWLRIVRTNMARVDLSDMVDFRFSVQGKTVKFRGVIYEENEHDKDISTWIKKQDKFSLRLAVEEEMRIRRILKWELQPRLFGNSDERFAWLRDQWCSLPSYIRPVLYFLYRYFLRLGFLDGKGGFLYHFLQGFWLRIIVDFKMEQLRKLQLSNEELIQFQQTMLLVRDGSVMDIWNGLKENTHVPG